MKVLSRAGIACLALIVSTVSVGAARDAQAQDGTPPGVTLGGPFKLTAEDVSQIQEQTGLLGQTYNMLFAGQVCDAVMSNAPGGVTQGVVGLGSLLGLCPSMEEMLVDGIDELNDYLEDLCAALEHQVDGRTCTFTPNDIEPTCDALGDFCKNQLNPYLGITVNAEGDAYCWGRFTIPGCTCDDKPPGRLKYYPVQMQNVMDELLGELLPAPPPSPAGVMQTNNL